MNESDDILEKYAHAFRNALKTHQFDKEKHQCIEQEWKKFVDGSDIVDHACIPPEILQSWKRCRKANLNPLSQPEHIILEGDDLKKMRDDNQELLDIGQPFLDQLYQFAKKSLSTVGMCDAKGYLLDVRTEPSLYDLNMNFKWYPGVLWSEEAAGNNIVSTVLKSRKPSVIFGPQHFKKCYHPVSASGAPISNSSGKVLGGIIVTGYCYGGNPHALGMTAVAASAIEHELDIQKSITEGRTISPETEIASGLRQAIASSIPEALIAVDNKWRIAMINEKARARFFRTRRTIEGESLSSVFSGPENASLIKMIRENESFSDVEVRIFSRNEQREYALTCHPILTPGGKKIGKILVFSEIKKAQPADHKSIGAKAAYRFSDIQGLNRQFQKAIEQARMVSQSSSNVLILGESGTGKDLIAQAIHNASPRKDGPYIAINCAAIPRELIASELFGYSEGAFTGSRRGGNEGKFELADGGTIFLDEIAETPLELQAVLLRVIEEKAVVRIGEGRVRPVDVRIISATNKDLIDEVSKGTFRKDLFYRLNVFAISIPPLRERTDDIPLLIETFVQKYSAILDKKISGIDKKIRNIFMNHAWPGNVRELQNVVERMINFASGNELTVDLIPPEILNSPKKRKKAEKLESPEESEKKMIRHLLTLKFRKNQIAERMNISRVTLFRKIKKYGLTELARD